MANIGFDLDGVIIDHTENKIKKAGEFGFHLAPFQTPHDVLKPFLPRKVYHEVQTYIYNEASLSAPPVEKALDIIETLAKTNSLFIISRRITAEIALAWLQKHNILSFIPERNVFFVPYNIPYSKDIAAKKVGIGLFVDDETKILRELPSVKTRIHFNQYESAPLSEFNQIKRWQELLAIIKTAP